MKKRQLISFLILLTCFVNLKAQSADVFNRQNIKAKMLKVAAWQLKNPNHEPTD